MTYSGHFKSEFEPFSKPIEQLVYLCALMDLVLDTMEAQRNGFELVGSWTTRHNNFSFESAR